MITPPPESSTHATTNPLSHFIQATLSYDSNIMLAAIISLLLVILFVLLLNIYARWFLVQARQRSRSSVTVPNVLGSRFHRFTIIDTTSDSSPSKGLHPSLISSLPLFVYYNPNDEANKQQHGLECAICISSFEEEEVGRKLPKCGHAFHVECIDMWLHSHSTCPICRAAVVCEAKMNVEIDDSMPEMLEELLNFTGGAEIDVVEDLSMETEYNVRVGNGNDLVSGFSSLESSLGGSLKRILSSNRTERRVHPSAGNVSELEV